ncbi:MAG: choline/carnitine O-acyltransferase [Cardiobacteriaceae bacterium]|nr:choline/carnitine O-acyltransferase [Cardiobacteriaceae bacterium]
MFDVARENFYNLPALPLPALKDAIDELEEHLDLFQDSSEKQEAFRQIEKFLRSDADSLYQALVANAEQKAPDSWLFNVWRKKFLKDRECLAISGNDQVVQLDWNCPQKGLKRAALFIASLLKAHKFFVEDEFAEGKLGQFIDKKEFAKCREQWKNLSGTARRPAKNCDELLLPSFWSEKNQDLAAEEDKTAHIVVLFNSSAWKISVCDEKAKTANPAQIENALYQIIENSEKGAIAFSAPAKLDNKTALEIRSQMISRGENSQIMHTIEKALFVVALRQENFSEQEAYFDAAFSEESHWSYKSINYSIYLSQNLLFAHFDQTVIDNLSIISFIKTAENIFNSAEINNRKNNLDDDLDLKPLVWKIDGQDNNDGNMQGTIKLLSDSLVDYRRKSELLGVEVYDFFLNRDDEKILDNYNERFIVQILLQYAQLKCYGFIRPISEEIDMRHFFNGRYEKISAVQEETMICAKAVLNNELNPEIMQWAEKKYIKNLEKSMSGKTFYGFCLALAESANAQDIDVSFLRSQTMNEILNPFITVIPNAGNNVRVPNNKLGFTVSYQKQGGNYHFIFTHYRNKAYELKQFIESIDDGIKNILLMLRNGGFVKTKYSKFR